AELVLDRNGDLVSLQVIRSGGLAGFDDAVKEILRDSVPFPSAPVDALSDDERVHLRWTFARDQRRCSDVTILRFEEPVAIAFPKLLRAHREEEIWRRARLARDAGTPIEPMLTMLASAWMKTAIARPYSTVE